MQKERSLVKGSVALFLALALCSCGKRDEPASAGPHGSPSAAYFKTPWQDESQFIVTAIVSDLAEMTYYAKHKSLPSLQQFSVTVAEKPDSPFGSPVYLIEVALDKSTPAIKATSAYDPSSRPRKSMLRL